MDIIGFEDGERNLTWPGLCDALRDGHARPKAEINDMFLYRVDDTMLTRAAWIDGLGALVKTAMVYPGNPGRGEPMIYGGVNLYSDRNGELDAVIDFHLVTKWKTAGDSVFAAKMLARPDSHRILIVGAGTVGHNLRAAYGTMFPDAEFLIWNRSGDKAQAFAEEHDRTSAVTDLEEGVRQADIVTSATMSTEPLLRGDWLRPGQHIDLIGAYRPDMREADDAALLKSCLFVDSRDTTLDHIGELKIPLAEGVIQRDAVVADFYDIASGAFVRRSDDEITLFKNGGGAHMDLMTSKYILDSYHA